MCLWISRLSSQTEPLKCNALSFRQPHTYSLFCAHILITPLVCFIFCRLFGFNLPQNTCSGLHIQSFFLMFLKCHNIMVGEGLIFSLCLSLFLSSLYHVLSSFTHLFFLFLFFSSPLQKHKERDRHKPKHKKTMDMSPSLVLPNIMVPDKVRALLYSSLLCVN